MTQNTPSRRIRAGDAERDAVLEVMQEAYSVGRLSAEELQERQDQVLRMRYTDELYAAVDDLPEASRLEGLGAPAAAVPARRNPGLPGLGDQPVRTSFTVMSGRTVDIAPGTSHYMNFAMWGGDDIYLDDVMGPGVVVTLELHSLMAGHHIYVPEGVRVVDDCFAIMAGNDVDREARGDGSNGTLVLKGVLFWAGSDVKLASRKRRR